MKPDDTRRFQVVMAKLGEIFAKQITPELTTLYWQALKAMPIEQIEAGADAAIAHLKFFPKPAEIRHLAEEQATPGGGNGPGTNGQPDHAEFFGNRLLLRYLFDRRTGASSGGFTGGVLPEMDALIELRRSLVAEFVGYIREGDDLATPAEFIRRWLIGLQRIGSPSAAHVAYLKRIAESPNTQNPMPAAMARPIVSRGTSAAHQ